MSRLLLSSPADLRHFSVLQTPIWVFDLDRHGIWWANDPAITFWKADSLEDLRGRDFSDDSDTVRTRLRQIVRDWRGGPAVQETWTLYPKDETIPTLLSFQPVRLGGAVDRDGVLVEVCRTFEEVDDPDTRRLIEAARGISAAVASFTLDGQLLTQNPTAASWYGGATNLQDRFADPETAQRALTCAKTNQALSVEALMRRDHGLRWHLVSVQRGRDPVTGQYTLVLCEEDISAQRMNSMRQQQANRILKGTVAERTNRLRLSEERFALAAEMAAIWDWNVLEDKVFLSASLARDLGYTEDEMRDIMRAEGVLALVSPKDHAQFRAIIDLRSRSPEDPISEELRFVRKDGTLRWYHAQGRMLCDATGQLERSVGLLTDITQRKQLESTLRAAHRLEAIGQLTGGIAHDINNLLTVIQGNAELLQELGQADPDLTQEIVSAVARGARLTDHLLAFARRQRLKPCTNDLAEILDRLEGSLLRLLNDRVSVNIDVAEELWPVWADTGQLEAALMHVALNARDAMPDGGQLTLTCRNRVIHPKDLGENSELTPGTYVEIAVSDTGAGMIPDTLSRAFEPFFTTKGVGGGLGLSMVLGFSRQSGGDTRIENRPEGGTRVVLYLPRALTPEATQSPSAPATYTRGSGEHVHILEDSLSVRNALKRMLHSLGYRTTASSTVNDALGAYGGTDRPDVFLVDVHLGSGQCGLNFLHALRALDTAHPVVLMSGLPLNPEEVGLAPQDMPAFLPKPIERQRLASTLAGAVRAMPRVT
ncbi:ATP-binding protein [Sagittula sp. SSi028]|uniref:hybrid sensor histidine kinase/response regulator n=1 Tax=Sagittula sp. SSi028 TaxID=3400636 RepID=UPI003AF743F3